MSKRKISRREFLHSSIIVGTASIIAGCTPATAVVPAESTSVPVVPPTATTVPTEKPLVAAPTVAPVTSPYKESPILASLVKAGTLPPVEKRLPENPVVVVPAENVGKYGGTWTTGSIEKQGNDVRRNIGYEQLLRWTPLWDGILPNVAESYEANEDATKFTFHLRKGLKWSDGEPFTADDIMFWYDDVIMNPDLFTGTWGYGVPFTIEKVDDFTFAWKFENPNGLFIKQLAVIVADYTPELPKHYLQQFHKKYNPDVEKLVQENKANTWVELFNAKMVCQTNSDLPVLWPWKLNADFRTATTQLTAERNPYYFKVDTEGNQLPYIDNYVCALAQDNEVLILKGLNGELDFQEQWINDPKNKPVFFDGQEKGKYHFWELTRTTVNEMVIMLNMTCKDLNSREVASNRDLRIGLSHAIDRQEIIDTVFVGNGKPHQAGPRPESIFYHERLATQYTEFSLDKANEYLDKTGWTKRDAQGFRLGPDGKRISFTLEVEQARTAMLDSLELIKPNWEKVGVELNIKPMEKSFWNERVGGPGQEQQASANKFGGGSGYAVLLDPRYYIPLDTYGSQYGQGWAWWRQDNNDTKSGVVPPDEVKKAYSLWDQLSATSDEKKQQDLMKQILDIAADFFYAIGTVLEANSFGIVTNRMKNTPKVVPYSWIYPAPNPSNTCQFYIEE
jgi:peptide/nickel transport system substrate-binding protein